MLKLSDLHELGSEIGKQTTGSLTTTWLAI